MRSCSYWGEDHESRALAREYSHKNVSEEELLLTGNASFPSFHSSLLSLAAATGTQLQKWGGDLMIVLEKHIFLSSGILKAGSLPFLVGLNVFASFLTLRFHEVVYLTYSIHCSLSTCHTISCLFLFGFMFHQCPWTPRDVSVPCCHCYWNPNAASTK